MAQTIKLSDQFGPGIVEALGWLVVACGRLEYTAKLTVKNVAGQGFTGGMAIAEHPSLRQMEKLRDHAKAGLAARQNVSPQVRRECESLMDAVVALAKERHDMLHAFWNAHTATEALRVRPEWDKAAKDVDWSKSRPVTLTELQDLRKRVDAARTKLDKVRRKL